MGIFLPSNPEGLRLHFPKRSGLNVRLPAGPANYFVAAAGVAFGVAAVTNRIT